MLLIVWTGEKAQPMAYIKAFKVKKNVKSVKSIVSIINLLITCGCFKKL